MQLKRLVIFLGIIFWPVSLFINNTSPNFINYILPIFEPKVALFPLIFFALRKNIKLSLIFLFISLINFNRFWGQTIFKPDYEAQQSVIRQTLLYPNTFTARLFHNKARIYIDKFNNNIFALTDPNNYFFKFHPNEIIIDNQNLKKFPSFALFVVIYGLFTLQRAKHKNLILSWLFGAILSLSVLTSFDRNDFILWPPLCLIFVHGANQIKNKLFWTIFIIFSIFELWQIII